MCTPKTPSVDQTPPEVIATPTMVDASVQKAGASARKNAGAAARQNIKTNPQGLNSVIETDKKTLLGA